VADKSAGCMLKVVDQSLSAKAIAIELKSALLKSRNEWLSSSIIKGTGTW